jgi:hypothetical protein
MTIADMFPGYAYEPGMSILTVCVPPADGAKPALCYCLDIPLHIEPAYRDPTPENALFAFRCLSVLEPETYNGLVEAARASVSSKALHKPAASHA